MPLMSEGIRREVLPRVTAIGLVASLALTACVGGEQVEDERSPAPVTNLCPAEDELISAVTPTTTPEAPERQLEKVEKVAVGVAQAALADIRKQGEDVRVYVADVPGDSPIPTYGYGVPPKRRPEGDPIRALELTYPDRLFVRFIQNHTTGDKPIASVTASFLVSADTAPTENAESKQPTPRDFAAAVDPARLDLENLTYSYHYGNDICGGAISNIGKRGVAVTADIGEEVFPVGVDLDTSLDMAEDILAGMRVS